MLNRRQLEGYFRKIQVVRAPKRRLATFGTSRIDYQVVTEVPGLPDRSRLRTGLVTAEKPQIIVPSREQFEGFGPESARYADALVGHYGEALRGLEYQFRNEVQSSHVELRAPDEFLRELASRHDTEGFHSAVISGTDKLWELALMKFIVEETLASFRSNVKELEEHGFFETKDDVLQGRHREIQGLFRRAGTARTLIPVIAAKLKEYDLFDAYQDQFFRLVNP
jgi:hypothetical protein